MKKLFSILGSMFLINCLSCGASQDVFSLYEALNRETEWMHFIQEPSVQWYGKSIGATPITDYSAPLSPNGVYSSFGRISLIACFGNFGSFQKEGHVNPYGFLSNYYDKAHVDKGFCPALSEGTRPRSIVLLNGKEFTSVEAAYQYCKMLAAGHSPNIDTYTQFDPDTARTAARKAHLPPPLFGLMDQVMFYLLLDKFSRNEPLKEALFQLEQVLLVEGNQHGDNRWGAVYAPTASHNIQDALKGENKLGRMLMYIASILKKHERQIGEKLWMSDGVSFNGKIVTKGVFVPK